MSPNRPRPDFRPLFLLVAALLGCPLAAPAQNVVLHLRNGDRLAGTIVTETTNQVTLATTWIKELAVPLAQIERRETFPPGTNVAGLKFPTRPVITGTNPPAVNTNTFWRRWKGEVALGTDLIFGGAERQIYYGHGKLTYAQPYAADPKQFFRDTLTFNAEYGETGGIRSANKIDGASKTDFDLSRRYYLYNLGGAGYDEIRKINLRYEEGPGMGYHWLTQSNFVVNLEAGANYQEEYRSDDTTSRNFYYRLAENITWKISKQLTLGEKLEIFPEAENLAQYRTRLEATLSYALLTHLSLNLTTLDLYDTRPAAGVTRNEFQLRTSLGVKF